MILHVECNYPTFFDSVSDRCVTTCPQGTIGNISRSDNTTESTRNCTSRELHTYDAYTHELTFCCLSFTLCHLFTSLSSVECTNSTFYSYNTIYKYKYLNTLNVIIQSVILHQPNFVPDTWTKI